MSTATDIRNNIEKIAGEPTERKTVDQNKYSPPSPDAGTQQAQFFDETKRKEDTLPKTPAFNSNPGNLDEGTINASGKTGAFIAGGIVETIFELTEIFIFSRKFTKEEKEVLLISLSKPETELTEPEKSTNYKFYTLMKKREKVKEKIPMTEKENEALEHCFREWTKATGKPLPPGLIIASTMVKIVSSRAIEIFLA